MKLRKATIYFYDANEDCQTQSLDGIINEMEILFDRTDMGINMFNAEEVDIGEWHDSIDLNKIDCDKLTYESYFRKERQI